MMKLFYTYMTFAIDSPDFSLTSLQEIVICKNNSIHTFLNSSFNTSILSTKNQNNKAFGIFIAKNIEKNKLMPFIHKQKKIEIDVPGVNMGIKEKKKEVHVNLRL